MNPSDDGPIAVVETTLIEDVVQFIEQLRRRQRSPGNTADELYSIKELLDIIEGELGWMKEIQE